MRNFVDWLQLPRTQLVLITTVVVWILVSNINGMSQQALPHLYWGLAGMTAVVWAGVFGSSMRAWQVLCGFFAIQPVLFWLALEYSPLHAALFESAFGEIVAEFFHVKTLLASSPSGILVTGALVRRFPSGGNFTYLGSLTFATIWQWYLIWEFGAFCLQRWKSEFAVTALFGFVLLGVAASAILHFFLLYLIHD